MAKCLIVHVLFGSYNASSVELRNKKKATQQWNFLVANDIVLSQVRVCHERVYAANVVSKFWLVRSFSYQRFSKFIINNASENVPEIRTTECKTSFFNCKLNLNFLRSSRLCNCDTVFVVIAPFFNESAHGSKKIRKGRVKTRFQIAKF